MTIAEYQYDAAGNRNLLKVTLAQVSEYSSKYYANSDRLMTDGKYAFAYDAAGNLIKKGNQFRISGDTVTFATSGTGVGYWEYAYDLLNQLIKVTKNGTIVSEYQYDPTGLRVVKKAKRQTTHYVFEGTEPIFGKKHRDGSFASGVLGQRGDFFICLAKRRMKKSPFFYQIPNLDYDFSSIGVDLGSVGGAVKKIRLVPGDNYLNHRIDATTLDLFVSADNRVYTPLAGSSWSYSKEQGVITLTMKTAVQSRYLKLHVKLDERDQLFKPIDQATFMNTLAKTVEVYQEVSGRTEEYQYDAAGNRTLLKVTLAQVSEYSSKYYANSDRLMTDGKYAFAYDAAGNVIKKGNQFRISGDTVTFATSGTGVV